MLLTFEQIADIPEKMHIFYQQAFETLFHRHDATKEMYKRERFTSYPVDEFRRYFGAFCLVTYLDQKFSFDEESALSFVDEAFELEGTKLDTAQRADFLRDLMMSVCMLQRDGSDIQFSHRSFQEYFFAVYICGCSPAMVGKLLDEIVSRAFFDRTLTLIRDMNPEIFDRHWTVPRLAQIAAKAKNVDPKIDPKGYIKLFCDMLVVLRQPLMIHFQPKGRIGRNWMLIKYIYQRSDLFIAGEMFEEKIKLIAQYNGPLPENAPRMRYPIDDLKPELVRELLPPEKDKRDLTNLYNELKGRYDRKDEQVNRLLAKSRK
jgi:hypothetical protein